MKNLAEWKDKLKKGDSLKCDTPRWSGSIKTVVLCNDECMVLGDSVDSTDLSFIYYRDMKRKKVTGNTLSLINHNDSLLTFRLLSDTTRLK